MHRLMICFSFQHYKSLRDHSKEMPRTSCKEKEPKVMHNAMQITIITFIFGLHSFINLEEVLSIKHFFLIGF